MQLTYFELTRRANRFAHYLLKRGVTTGTFVGLCVMRTTEMIVALLGILKAGGTYVPLDPAYPSERLSFMIEDSNCKFIIVQKSTKNAIALNDSISISIDEIDENVFTENTNPMIAIEPNNLAYIIYTSGSTGNPKGVMVEHRSLAAFAKWTQKRFTKKQTAYVLCASSLSFDVSIFEYTLALTSGGTLVIVDNVLDLILNPPAEPISIMASVPSPVAELVHSRAIPASLNTLILGGEVLQHALANELYASTGIQELFNVWGVTEDTIGTTSYVVPRFSTSDPPIGEVIDGRAIHLLDSNLNAVPDGTPGELCCTGIGVARGYLNQPELTATRFVRNPYDDSELLYRSGDLAIRTKDGKINFIGRNDQQVKIRGFRIELGEIETVISEHPLIAQVSVIAKSAGNNEYLAMFAVLRLPKSLSLIDVAQFCAARLPAYMIPSTLTILDHMPLTPTGKTDRNALKQLVRKRPKLAQAYIAPRDEMEQQLAKLFMSLLGLDCVGVRDNFFAIGGQSLLAARIVADSRAIFPEQAHALEKRKGERALILSFWQVPTIEQLATTLQDTSQQSSFAEGDIQCLQNGIIGKTPLFIFHGVVGTEAFYTWNLALAFGPQQPVYIVAPHGIDGKRIPLTIEEMAADYLEQVRRIQPYGPYQFSGFCNGAMVCYEMARMLEAEGIEVRDLLLIGAPGHNVHFKLLERFIGGISRLFRVKPAQRQVFYMRARRFIVGLATLWRTNEATPMSAPNDTAPPPAKNVREDAITATVQSYVPKRYGGSVTLIYGKEDEYLKHHKPFEDWPRIVRHFRGITVEGGHHFIQDNPEQVVPYFGL